MNSLRARAWLAAGLIFVVGLVVGGALTAFVGVRLVRQTLQRPAHAPALAERAAGRIGRELTRELELRPAEAVAVQRELDQGAFRLRGARVRYARELGRETRAAFDRVSEALPPEKRAAFQAWAGRRFEKLGLRFATPGDSPEASP